jgi:drug/metabolite transporter (DMT)-like permease
MLAFLVGVGVALAAASSYSVGVILQSLEAREVPSAKCLRPGMIQHLVGKRRWVLGTLCVMLGWALQAGALSLAPLTVVQPALAVGLFVLLIAGTRLSDECVGRREILAVIAIAIGVAGLSVASPKSAGGGHAALVIIAPVLAVFALAALAPYLLRERTFPLLVVMSAGLAYAWSGFMTKFVAEAFSRSQYLAAAAWLVGTACAAGLGLISEMTALQRQSAIRVFPGVLVIQIVVAVLLAPLLAGEQWSADPLVLVTLAVSLAVLAAGTAVLASAGAVAAVVDSEGASQPEPAAAGASRSTARTGEDELTTQVPTQTITSDATSSPPPSGVEPQSSPVRNGASSTGTRTGIT